MAKEETIVVKGIVKEVLPNTIFRIDLVESGLEILGHLGGKLRQNRIRVLTGDSVEVEMSPYDLTRGRIVYRNK